MLLACTIVAKLLAISLLLASANTLADTSVLEEIVVTATRTEKLVRVNPYSVSLITQEKIGSFNQDQLADLVDELPGVFISDAGQAGQKRIRIRGEDARRMALLIDGQEFLDHREVGVPLLVDPSRIQRVELVRGPASVLYGPKAMGGVINVITESTHAERFQADLSLTLNSATDGHLISTQLHGQTAGGMQWNLGGFRNDQGTRDTPDGEVENTAYESDGANLGIGYTTPHHRWRIALEQFRSESGVYVEPEVRFSPPLRDFIIEIPRRDRRKTRIDYRYTPTARLLQSITFDAFRQRSDREFNTFPLMTLPPGLNIDTSILTTSDLTTDGASLHTDWQFGDGISVIGGLQWMSDEVDQIRDRQVSTNGIPTAQQVHTDSARIRTSALYLQGDARVNDALSILVGMRTYDVDSDHLRSNHVGALPNNSDAHTVASVSAIYSTASNSTVRLVWSEGYIYPSLLNLAVGAYAGSKFINPVPTLRPETSDTYEIGYRTGEAWSLDAVAFLTRSRNYIDHVACLPSDQCLTANDEIYRNVGEANSHGIELIVSHPWRSIDLDAAITWIKREKVYEGVDTWDSGIPQLSGHISATYTTSQWRNPMSIDLAIRYESDATEVTATRQGQVKRAHSGWGVLDLTIDYRPSVNTRMSLALANLTDKGYRSASENIDAPGRHARLRLSVTL